MMNHMILGWSLVGAMVGPRDDRSVSMAQNARWKGRDTKTTDSGKPAPAPHLTLVR